MGVLLMSGLTEEPKVIHFPTSDGGLIYADAYGNGEHGVVLAHGMRFNKASWQKQAEVLDNAGFRVLAIDFRGYGQSRGGGESQPPYDDLDLDILAAVRYLRQNGAKTVSVIGGSMGGGAAANAAIKAAAGEIDRLVLLAPVPIQEPERIKCRKFYILSRGDPMADKIRKQYEKAPEPKDQLLLDGSAHAQAIFLTNEGERVMHEILRFLSQP
jgi:pimeloyl-ACP methyl ester carboxylesterase